MDVLFSVNEAYRFLKQLCNTPFENQPIFFKSDKNNNVVYMDLMFSRNINGTTYNPIHCIGKTSALVDDDFQISVIHKDIFSFLTEQTEDKMICMKLPDKLKDGTCDFGWFEEGVYDTLGSVSFEVSDIKIPTEPLPEISSKYCIRYDDMGQVAYEVVTKNAVFVFPVNDPGNMEEVDIILSKMIANYKTQAKKGDRYDMPTARRGHKAVEETTEIEVDNISENTEVVENVEEDIEGDVEENEGENTVPEEVQADVLPEVVETASEDKPKRKGRRTKEQVEQDTVDQARAVLEERGYVISKSQEEMQTEKEEEKQIEKEEDCLALLLKSLQYCQTLAAKLEKKTAETIAGNTEELVAFAKEAAEKELLATLKKMSLTDLVSYIS